MEVTLKTEVEAGASGFSVKGGGNEGIFIKKVLKESPASKIFSLREGDQLLSATIFFDNIKYEDALKILQYSEPYRVQFSLKRKIAVQEDLEHSTAQHKREKIGQEKEFSEGIPEETLHVSGKAISEEDRETLIVSQRVGRSKRPKKDRLSWPKFQSIKNKKILRHRRSHSTSDAYEPAVQDISPTSTDTESQFPQEVHTKEKKGSQRKLKFPSIGFRMHRSRPEPQEKQKKEIKTTLISEKEKIYKDDISLENPEILTVEYTTSPAYEMKTGEGHETLTKDLKEMKNGIPSHVKQCPEVEISIKKEKDKEATSKFSVPEVPDITTEISKPSLETADLKVSPTEKSPQASSKSRKKKQKGTADKKDGESGINIDLVGHSTKGYVQVKGLEIGTAKAELQTSDTLETGEKQAEQDTQILNIQKINYGISVPKKKETDTDTTKQGSDVPHSVPEKTADMTLEDSRNFNVKTLMPDAESDVSTSKIQMPSFKVVKEPKTDMKMPREESREDTKDSVKKERMEDNGMPTNDKALNIEIGMKRGEKDIDGKESKFRLPKLKFPTFTWSTTKEETAQPEAQISEKEAKVQTLENAEGLQVSGPPGEIRTPSADMHIGISIGKRLDNNIKQNPEGQFPSPKESTIKSSPLETKTEDIKKQIWISKRDIEIETKEFNKISKDEISEITPSHIKAPKVDISLPSVDVTLPQAGLDLQAPEATLSLEGEAKVPEKEAGKTRDGKFKMPKFGMPSFGWSSSKEAKGTVAAEVDVSLQEPQVTVPSGATEVEVSLPAADIQAPSVEVTVETAPAAAEGEKGRFKMPDVKMPSVKLPKVKAPQAQVSLPKAEVSLPKGQEGEVVLQGPEAEASLEVAAGKAEGGGMKIHMPKVKVPSVVFSKPTVKSPKLDADVSLPQAELKAADADITITAPDVTLPSVEGSLEIQAPDADLKAPSAEGKLELEGSGLKGKLKMPKFDKPKFTVSSPKAVAPTAEVSLPSAEVDLPSTTVTAAGEGTGWKLEKPSLKMPKADVKAPKVDISLPSVDVTLPQAGLDLQAPEATLSLEGEAKVPEKEAGKTKDGKFKMPKFGMPSFGWSSSKEAKGTVAAEVDVSLQEPQVTVPSGATEVEVSLPAADIQAPSVEVTVETAPAAAEGEKGRFKMPDVKMPSVKLPKVKAPQAQVSLPKAEVSLPKGQEGEVVLQGPEAEASLEVAAGKAEGGGMKIHMPKVKVPSVVFSKPTVKSPKLDADVSLPQAELKAADADITITAPDVTLPSVEGSLEIQAPDADLKAPSDEGKLELEGSGLKGKLKMPKFDKPKFTVSSPKAVAPTAEVSLPSAEVDLPSTTVTAAGEGTGWKLEKPSLKMPKADVKAPKVDISLPSVDVTLPQAGLDLQAPEATLSLEGEAKVPEKEAGKTKDGKFKMPKFGMPSFGWSSSKEAKGTVAAEVDVSLQEPQVTVPSGATEVEVSLPAADIQAPSVEVTVETAPAAAEGEKGRFKMPDVKMPSVKLPKVKAPQAQVSLPKAEVSLPKGQEGEVVLQGPEAEASLEVAAGKAEGGGMKIHMPKVKVPSVVFSKPTVKSPKLDADVSLPQAELKAADADITITAPDVTLPSVEGSLEIQAPDADLKAPSDEGKLELEGSGLKGKLKMPKFDKPKFTVSSPKAVAPTAEVSLPSAEVDLPSTTVTAAGEGTGWKLEKPSLKMPKADVKAPKVDISLPSVDVTLPQAGLDLQAPEATLSLEGEAKVPEKEAGKTKDGKFKMPKFGMPSFGWSSSKEAKGTVAAEVDVSLQEPQVTVPSGATEVEVSLPAADIQAPSVEVTVETAPAAAEGEKGRFKMPDVKMPSVKLPKVKAPQAQVSLPKAEVSLPKGQEGEVALQGPEAEASLEVAAGKAEGGGMKIHMPKVKVPSVVFSKPTVKSPKLDADVSLPQAELKAADADITITAPDVTLPSVEGSLEIQAPDADLKAPSAEGKLELEGSGLKGKLKMPKFDKPKFTVSSPKAVAPTAEVSLPSAEVDLPSTTVTAAGEGTGWKLEKPSLKMPKADVKAPKVDISLPSVDVTLPQAGLDLQAPEATLSLEGEAKVPEKEAGKTKDGKFKMPKFGMPSFGWSSSKEAKGTVAAEVDVSLQEPQVTVPSGATEVEVSLPAADIQAPSVEVTVETAPAAAEGEKGRFKMPDVKMPSVKLPKVKAPQAQVSLPKAEVSLPKGQEGEVVLQGPEAEASLEVAAGKAEGGGMKIHMPKVKVPSVVFSKPTVKSPKLDADVSLPQAELKAADADITITAPDVTLPSVEGSLEIQAPDADLKAPSAEGKLELEGSGLKGKLKMPKFDKPKFTVSSPKAVAPTAEVSLPSAEVDLPSTTVTAAGEGTGWKLEKPSLKMPKADVKAPKVDISLPSVDVTLPQAGLDLQAPEATLSLEGEAKVPEKEAGKTKDGKFKMPKFGMPSFGWSSSKEAKGTVAAEVDVSLQEPQVTVPSGATEVEVSLPAADIQAPSVEVTVETAPAAAEGEKGRFKMPDVKMPSVKLPKVKAPQAQVSLPKAEVSLPKGQEGEVVLQGPEAEASLEVAAGKAEGGGMKIHMPKVKVPSVVFSKPTVKSPKLDADVSLPQAELKAADADITITAPDVTLPSVEGSLEIQAPDADLKAPSDEGKLELEGSGLKGKLKMPKFDKPKFTVSSPKAVAPTAEVSLPSAEVDLPSTTVTAAGEGTGWKLEKPSLKMPKADVKAPKVDISLPSVDVTLPQAGLDLQAPEATLSLEGEAKVPEKEAGKTKDGKFKMPKFGMPSFGWSSSKEAKGTVAAEVDVSLQEPQVTVPSGATEVEVSLPAADIQAPSVEVTVETAPAAAEGEKGRFKMPDVKMPSVKLPKVKAPQAQVSLPKAEVSLPKGQEGEVVLQGPEAEASLEVAAGKAEGGGMKIHMPKVKVPSVVFSKPTVKSPKLDADVSLPQAELKAADADITITAPDVTLPSVEGSLEIQAPDADLKAPSDEGKLELEGSGLKGKLKMPKFDKPKFTVSSPKAVAPTAEVSLPSAEVDLPSTTVTAAGEGTGWKLEKPSLKMPKADVKAPKVDISLPSVDVTLPQAGLDLQAPEATLSLEGEAKVPEKEAGKTKDGKFKMPKFGMPSFGWSSSKEAKGTVAAEVDVSLQEPQVTVPSGATEVEVSLPAADIQAPSVEVTVETAPAAAEGEKGRFKMPDVKMPSVKLPKVKAPQAQVSLPKAEVSLPKGQEGEVVLQGPEAEASLEVAAGKAEGGGMKIHMPKVKVPSVVFSKPTVKSPKLDADVSLPQAELKAADADITITAPDVTLPSVEGSLEIQAPDADLKAPSAEGKLELEGSGLKGKLKMPKFDKPKFTVSSPKAVAPTAEVSLPSAEVDLPSTTVTAAGEGTGWKLEKPSLKMPKADVKAPKVDISLPSVDVTLPQAGLDLQAPEATLSLEGEAKVPEKEAGKTKDGKFKMPKFGMPSFGWSSSKEAKGTVAAEVDVSLQEPQVTVPSGATEVEVSLPAADIQAPSVEVTVETAPAAAEGEKGRFKMPDVKMPSVKLPKVKAPQAQVSLPKAEVSLPKGQEGEVVLQGPEAEASLEVAAGKAEGGGMKIHMPKVKVPSVVFSKPTVKSPKLDADVSLPQAELKAADADITITAPDVTLPSVEGSLEIQAPDADLKAPSDEGKLELEGSGLKGKLKMPKFDKPKFTVSSPKAVAPTAEVSLPSAEVDLPSTTVTAAGEGTGWKLEKPSLKMPKADVKAPKVDISLPSVDVTLPQAGLDLQAPEATLSLEGEAKVPEKEAGKTKDGKFKMPKFGMPSFGWSSSKEAKGTVAAEVDVSLQEPQVTVPSGATEVEVSLPAADIQAPSVEVTVETAPAAAEGEKGRFKMPDVKMPSVKLPKVKAPQAQVSLPKAEVSLPKGQEGEVVLQGPEAEASLEVAAGKAEGGGMKIHMPKVKVPSVVFSKPTVKSPKLDADVSLPQAELKAADADITITAPDVTLPSVEGSLEIQAPDADLKAPSAEGKLELEGSGLKGKLKMPKFDKPKFTVSSPKAVAPTAEVSLPSAEVDLPSTTVTAAGEGTGWKLEKPSLKMPKADVKAPKVDISLPSVDVTLPQAGLDLQAPEATLSLEGEAKVPEKEAGKTKDGKFKMPKFGMPSFGWSSSKEAKGTVAAEVDVSLQEPQVTVPSGATEVEVSLPAADIQAPSVEVTVETAPAAAEGEKGRFKMPDVKMPSVKLPKVKAPQAQVSLPKAEVSLPKGQEGEVVLQGPEAEASLEVAAGKAEGGGMKIHMPKVKVPSVVFSKPTVKSPKLDADVSLPQAELKAADADITITAPDVTLPSVEGSLEIQAPDADLKAPSAEGKLELEGSGLKGKLKMPKFDKPKFTVSSPKAVAPTAEVSLPSAEVDLPSTTVTAAGEGTGWKLEKPSLKMPKADVKAPKVDISLPSVDVTLPQAGLDLQAPEATLSLEGEAKVPEKEAGKTKDGKFKMPKFGMPSFGWSSSKEAKGTVAAEVDVSLQEPQVTVPSGATEVEVSLPAADIQAPSVEVTVETAPAAAEGEKGRFKMPDVKMPSVKLPKVKAPQAQVSLPKAEVSLPKGQEGEVVLQGPEAEASLEVAAGKAEGGGMKIHMPKVKVPSVVFSKPTVKSPKLDADVSLPQAELKAADADITITAPDVTLPSVEGSLEIQAPDTDLKAPSAEGKLELEGSGLKGKLKMPKFDKPKFTVSSPKAVAPTAEVSLPSAEVDLPSTTVTAAGEGTGWKLEKPSLKMPKADVKAPKVDISLPSVDVTLPQAGLDLQAPEATLSLEGEAKVPEKEAGKTKDGKFKMPKFGMPSFGWSSSKEAKGTVAAEVDVSLQEPQVTVPSGATEVEVSLPAADIQAPSVEVTVETAPAAAEGEKGRFKMPDVKMPSVKLPKVKAPQAQVSLPKAEVSLPKGQEGEVVLQGPEAEASLEVAAGKAEGGGMKIHMPKVKVPSVVFSKPTVKSPKLDADVSLPQAELKAADADITITAPDVTLPSVEGSLEIQAPDTDLKAPSAEGKLELEGSGLKGKLKMPKFDKPKFTVSSPKAVAPTAEVSLPSAEVDLPSTTVTAAGEGTGWKLEKPSLKMPKADVKAPKVDISLPSVDVTLPQAGLDLQAPEATLSLEGEAKVPEKEAGKTKDGKFKMPKFGMPSFGWSSSKEAKGTVAAEVDVSLQEPQVTVPSGATEVEVSLPAADIQAPSVEVTVETAPAAAEGEKGRFKMPDVKMPSVKLPKVKAPQAQVSLPKAEVSLPKGQEGEVALQGPEAEASLEVAAGKAEGGGMKIHMPKVKVPSVVFSKPTVKSPKLDADVSLPQAELKAADADITITAPDVTLPSVEGSLEIQAPDTDLKAPSAEGKLELEGSGLKGKLKMPKFDKPKFTVSSPKAVAPTAEVSLPSAEVDLPSTTVTAAGEGTGWKLEKPSLKMPKADVKAPKVDISLPSVDVTLPQAGLDLQAPEATLSLEGEAKVPEKEAGKTKDGKFKMPKFGMPSFGWSSSKEAKGTVAAEVDVSLQEPQVTVPSGATEVEVSLPAANIQAPSVEVTVETAPAAAEGEKGRFKMPDVKMPSVKLPKVKAPQAQVSLPKAEVSLPKGQEGEVALQGPEAEASLEVAAGKAEGGGMKIHMPKVKVPSVVFSKPTVKSPKLDADVSLPQAELKAADADITITAPDVTLPSVEGSLEIQAPDTDLKAPSAEGKLKLEGSGLKGKLKMPKFDKPKFTVSSPKAVAPTAEVSLPSAEVDLPSSTVTAAGEGTGWKLEKPSLKMPKADVKAPKVDISLPSVDVTLPQAGLDLQAPEATLSLEGEAKVPEKEAGKTKDGKFKMPKFGMPSFGWSSSKEAKGTVAAEVDVSLQEPQVTVPSGMADVDMTFSDSEIQAPSFDVSLDPSVCKEVDVGKSKTSLFRMPKISLSKSFKPHAQSQSGSDVAVSETLCYSLTEETSDPSQSVEPKLFPDIKGESVSKSTKFRIPSIGFSKSEVTSSKIDLESSLQKGDITLTKYQINSPESKIATLADENLSDFEILCDDGSEEQGGIKLEGKTTSAEISLFDTEVTVKIPKFRKPKFRIQAKEKAFESDIGSGMESEISKGRITSDMTDPDIEKSAQISDAQLGLKLHKPSLEVVLDAPTMDPNLSSMEVTLPNLEAEIHGPVLECKAEQEVVTGEKGTEEKENKFKSSKFKLPSFRWSPKKEAIAPSHVEEHLEGPTLSTLSGDMGSELTFPTPENQYLNEEVDTTEKDGEKAKTKKSQFTMPKISFPKIKGQKVQVSLPVLETDISGPKQEIEGVSVQKSEKGSSGEGAGLGIEVPKVTVPTLEFSKPEPKAPKIEMDISMPTGEVKVPTCEGDELTLKSAAANASLSTSDIKMIPEGSLEVKSPDITVEGTSSEIAVCDVDIKAEGSEGKTKMSKFQMPKVGITLSKGKGSEKDVGQSKPEVKVPQLKATVEISDIAVEAPDLKVECGIETGTYSPEAKITKTDSKTSEADVHLPSADIPIPKTDSDIQDSDAAVKIKGEIKQDGDGEEKEGHFKMPKFKLPSFSWSPKKEASVKSDSGANLEDQKLAVMSSRIDTEVKGTTTDDQGSGPDLDLEISAGKVEQKSPIKKPQFVMPKISLSKIKVPKSQSQSPKVEADATLPKSEIEGDDSIKIPDIEKSHPEGTKEGAQITIKLADTTVHTLEFSRVETEASNTEITVSSAKTDASLTPSEGSFQQVDLKISSTNEGNIQKTGTKLPKGEASVDLKSPDMLTGNSSVVDGRKVKLEGPEGKIKMPKFQKTKFGISRTKGKVPETEISSPKIETEPPQLRTTNEIADIAVGVPASELTSDMSDPGVVDGKIKTPQALTGGIEDAKVDISTQSVPKPKTERVTESLGEKEIKLKEHEIKAEEVQTEEHQGWFKMPKFRIPAFGRSSLKEKKSDADIERSMEKAQATTPSAKVQTETSVPENTFSLPHAVAEITIGKEGIQKLGDSVKSSNVSLPKIEGDISLSTERTDSRVSIQKTETYADVVKRSAEGHTSEITVSAAELSKSYPSSETDKDESSTNRFPTCTLTFPEHKGKSQDINVQKVESSMKLETSEVECKPSSAEITLDATQKKIDVSLPKEELDSQNKEAAIKKGKIKGEVKIIGKDSEESQLKRTMCEWSTTEELEDGTYVTAKLEDLKVEVPTVKTDVKITGVDPEMKFRVKSVEKDVSAGVEVQVEDRAEISRIKAYKFKIPRFGMLHSETKGFEDDTNLPKSEADSAPKSERGTAEMQLQKPEGWIGLKSPALDHIEASARITGETVDQTQGVPEVSVRIPKLKIPRFTFRTPPIEADVLLSKVVTDPKGSSTDIEIVQLPASSAIPEETPGAVEGGIQKAKSKILTLTEPDIKTAQMTATIESSLSSPGQDIHWSYIEGQEVSEKVETERVAIERCEIYTTEILKESEILSSEVKTATLGFSLLKAKLPESHSDLDMLVQQPSPTGDASVRKPTGGGESFGVAAQRTGSSELKLSDKPHCESEESRGKVSLSKLKTSAAEVKGPSKLEESFPDKSPEGVTAAPLSEDEDVVEAVEGEEKDITNEKEKTDSKRSPGRFKFWLPSIGFSASGEEASTDAKAEIKKSVPEDVKPVDTSDDSSKQSEKTGWFRFPKLGFTSPSKKAKSVDKEEVGHKEGRLSDEDSPTDKPDVFFDARETLSPKEIGEGEKAETDRASSIVTSSARTELILLEEEKDSKSNIVGDTTK
ncbi:protein AHNAK2 [Vidua macroura]|uniref:protein AHNAK2 n=1 Tax=Vidua macroura TaxID=187451 RepID=UPI0023A7A2CD|nr:protein AHNAK2 [Vidua macroura]